MSKATTTCWCDKQGPAEVPGTLIDAATNAHRALHDVSRELMWPLNRIMDRRLAKSNQILETYLIERRTK